VANLVREADLFVLPSLVSRDGQDGGHPVALMEAMVNGPPVVKTALLECPGWSRTASLHGSRDLVMATRLPVLAQDPGEALRRLSPLVAASVRVPDTCRLMTGLLKSRGELSD